MHSGTCCCDLSSPCISHLKLLLLLLYEQSALFLLYIFSITLYVSSTNSTLGLLAVPLAPRDLKVPGSIPGHTSDFSNWDPVSPPCCEWYKLVLESKYIGGFRWRGSHARLACTVYVSHIRVKHTSATQEAFVWIRVVARIQLFFYLSYFIWALVAEWCNPLHF